MSEPIHAEQDQGAGTRAAAPPTPHTEHRPDPVATWLLAHWPALVSVVALAGLFTLAISSAGGLPLIVAIINGVLVLAVALLSLMPSRSGKLDGRLELLRDLQWSIKENETRYRGLLDEQTDMILRRDASGRLTFVNLAFANAFDLDALEAIGTTFRPTVLESIDESRIELTGRLHRRRSVELVVTGAGARWIEWDEHAVASAAGGGDSEIQSIGRDITAERLAAKQLSEARDQADSANRAKSRFLAAMSHEIRTPMNGILGMASLLIDTEQSSEQQTYTKAIDQSARNLVALIDEILDFSKIEAGKMVLSSAPFSISATVQGVVELFAASAQQKGLEIAWYVDRKADDTLIGDQARVRQIILNLVSNAVKFTDKGGIVVKVSRVGSLTRIDVQDTGIGLTDNDRKSLFTEFEQADAAIRRQNGGTGLGLAISKRLARAMGGDIAIASTAGHGSTFTVDVSLPIAPTSAPERDIDTSITVLLAFNRALERYALLKILRGWGVPARESAFESAERQLEAAAQQGQPIKRVIVELDIDPQLAGQLLAKARALHPDPTQVRGLVLVNVLTRRNLNAFHREGFDTYLVRPVRPQPLLEHIGALQPASATQANRAIAGPHALPFGAPILVPQSRNAKPRILVAEDNDINALLATHVLDKCGCHVVLVKNGRLAVEAATAAMADGGERFDVVFMDIFMPELDGIEAATEIKRLHAARPNVPAPPIIALTANAFSEDRERYLAAGMDDYLAKPFELDALRAILARWTGRDEDQAERLPAA